MSCPFLEKLAPETRNQIYEYVLISDTVLKHATNLQPFLQKICQRTDSETGSASGSEPSEKHEFLQRFDTSVLATSKLIYKEAIAIFYENNTIHFDATKCKYEDIVAPLATDLSLAMSVVTTINFGIGPISNDDFFQKCRNILNLADQGFKAIFPNLFACTLYIDTDATSQPATTLFHIADSMRRSTTFKTVEFESVGVVIASSEQYDLAVQYRSAMERWAIEIDPISILTTQIIDHLTARRLHEFKTHPHSLAAAGPSLDELFFARFKDSMIPSAYPAVDQGSYEYWTVVDEALRLFNLVQAGLQS